MKKKMHGNRWFSDLRRLKRASDGMQSVPDRHYMASEAWLLAAA